MGWKDVGSVEEVFGSPSIRSSGGFRDVGSVQEIFGEDPDSLAGRGFGSPASQDITFATQNSFADNRGVSFSPKGSGPTQRRFINKRRQAELGIIEGDPTSFSEADGEYFDLSAEQNAQLQADDERRSRIQDQKQYVRDNFNYPTIFVGPHQAAVSFANLATRVVDSDLADEVNRNLAAQEGAADELAGGSTTKRWIRSGTGSIMGALIPGGVAGKTARALGAGTNLVQGVSTGAAIGSAGLRTANESYTSAIDEGKSPGEALNYATRQGVIEAGVAGVFQKMGLGGLEQQIFGGQAKSTLKKLAWKYLTGLKQELPEELLTTVAQNLNNNYSGVDRVEYTNADGSIWNEKEGPSPFLRSMLETIGQTATVMGLVNTPSGIGSSIDAARNWVRRNPDQAEKLAAVENASRRSLAAAGLKTDSSNPTERQAAVDNVRAALAEIRAGDMARLDPVGNVMIDAVNDGVADVRGDFGTAQVPVDELQGHRPIRRPEVVTPPRAADPQPAYAGPGETATAETSDFGDPELGDTVSDRKSGARGKIVGFEKSFAVVESSRGQQRRIPIDRLNVRHRPGIPRAKALQPYQEGVEPFVPPTAETTSGSFDLKAYFAANKNSSSDVWQEEIDRGIKRPQPRVTFFADDPKSQKITAMREMIGINGHGIVSEEHDAKAGTYAFNLSPNQNPQSPPPANNAGRPRVGRAAVTAVFQGSQVTDLPDGDGFRVELPNGRWGTIRHVNEVPATKSQMEASVGRRMSDDEFNKARVKGAFSLTTDEGREYDGDFLIRLVDGNAEDSTVRHEALHLARAFGLISDPEYTSLAEKHGGGATNDVDVEEAIARAHQAWRGPDGLWKRIQAWLNDILSRFGVRPTADTAHRRINKGEVYRRKPRTNPSQSRLSVELSRHAAKQPKFKEWFAGSKVVNEDGSPAVVYHGTANDFDEFETDQADPHALYGPGIYLTSSSDVAGGDTGYAYKGVDPDTYVDMDVNLRDGEKWESAEARARKLVDEEQPDGLTSADVIFLRKQENGAKRIEVYATYGETMPNVKPLFAAIKNPIDMDEVVDVDQWLDVISKVQEARPDFDFDYSKEKLWELQNEGNVTLGDVYTGIRKAWNNDGNKVGKREANNILRDLGYDGIVHTGGLSGRWGSGVPHRVYIAFSPSQVKSATGNRGTFDPSNPDLRFQAETVSAEDRRLADLANPADNKQARGLVDVARREQGMPDVVPIEDAERAADIMIKKDRDGTRKKIVELGSSGKQLSYVETAAAKRLISQDGYNAIVSGDDAAITKAVELVQAYTQAGTEQARAFRMRFDPFETPTARNRRILGEAILGTTDSMKEKIRKAIDAGDKTLAKALEKQAARESAKIRDRLIDLGLLPKTQPELDALLKDNVRLERLVREAWARKGSGYEKSVSRLFEYWNSAGLLSGPATMARNFLGTPINYGLMMADRMVATAANIFTGQDSAADAAQSFRHYWAGTWPAIEAAGRHALQSYITESSTFDASLGRDTFLMDKLEGKGRYAIPGVLGRVVRGIGWGPLRATDQFFKAFIGTMEVGREAFAIAKAEGLSGDQLSTRIGELTTDLQSKAWSQAMETADKATFTERGSDRRSDFKSTVKRLRGVVGPVGRIVLPFVDTPVNIAAQAIERSPIGLLYIAGKIKDNVTAGRSSFHGLSLDLARQAVGMAMVVGIGSLFSDDDDREFAITSGSHAKNPYSLKMGDTFYSYNGLEPFATFFGAVTDAKKIFTSEADATAKAAGLLDAVIEQVANKPMLDGIGDVLRIIQGQGMRTQDRGEQLANNLAQYGRNLAPSFVPNLYRQGVRASQEYQPETKVWSDPNDPDARFNRLKDRVLEAAGAKSVELSKYDLWGNKKKAGVFENPTGDFLYRLMTPMKTEVRGPHPGSLMIAEWNRLNPDDEFKQAELSPTFTWNGKKFAMTDEQFGRYAELSGQVANRLFEAAKMDVENPTKENMTTLDGIFETAREEAKKIIREEIKTGKKSTINVDQLTPIAKSARVKTVRNSLSTGLERKKPSESLEEFQARRQKFLTDRQAKTRELQQWASE